MEEAPAALFLSVAGRCTLRYAHLMRLAALMRAHVFASPQAHRASPLLRAAAARPARAACATSAGAESPPAAPVVEWDTPPPAGWETIPRWLVFSDLHVSPRTLPYSLEVLQTVLRLARERQAGILFLGDFWHTRGKLEVPLLNAVLRALRGWDVATVMLPGNHDQVTLGGLEHSLTPLAAASPFIHVFDKPALWRGALWLPYRRDEGLLRSALAAAAEQSSPPLRAVFAHADVVGASANEAYQSRDGMDPSAFPQHIPTYTGHYHKPHIVPNTRVMYIGSPYQTTAGEGGQPKRAVLLDAHTWRHIEDVSLDIGPRHFETAGALPAVDPSWGVRRGDVVRWTRPRRAAAHPSAAATAQLLSDAGVTLNVAVEAAPAESARAPRIAMAEALSPDGLLRAFAEASRLPADVADAASRLVSTISSGSSGGMLQRRAARLVPLRVEVQNFGPFGSVLVSYPLGPSRGLVALSGRNEDAAASLAAAPDSGDDVAGESSNGAGKTSLAAAALWAIDGSSAGGLKLASTVHDGGGGGGVGAGGAARVRLEGTLNGDEFWVERTAKVSKAGVGKSTIRWGLAGVERTMAEQKLTIEALNEEVPVAVLSSSCFIASGEPEALLDLDDTKFSKRLGELVDLEGWEACEKAAKEQLKAAKMERAAAEGSAKELRAAAARAEDALRGAEANQEKWGRSHAEQLASAAGAEAAARAALRRSAAASARLLASLRGGYEAAAAAARAAGERAAAARQAAACEPSHADQPSRDAVQETFERELERHAPGVAAAEGAAEGARRAVARAEAAAAADADAASRARASTDAAAKALRAFVPFASSSAVAAPPAALSLVEGAPPGGATPRCDVCGQPVDAAHAAAHGRSLSSARDDAASLSQAASLRAAASKAALNAARDAAAAAAAAAARAEREAARAAGEAREGAAREAAEAARAADREAASHAADEASLKAAVAEATLHGKAARSVADAAADALGGSPDDGGGPSDAAPPPPPAFTPHDIVAALVELSERVEEATAALRVALRSFTSASAPLASLSSATNPHDVAASAARADAAAAAERLGAAEAARAAVEERCRLGEAVSAALGPKGVHSFLLDAALAEVEAEAGAHLTTLTGGLLGLSFRPELDEPDEPSSSSASSSSAKVYPRTVYVSKPDGNRAARAPRQLSGGERRRVGLALCLAFAAVAQRRSNFSCDLLVLDEPLAALDGDGCARVASLLRSLRPAVSTVVITAQAGTRAEAAADATDTVVKRGGCSVVELMF